MVVLSLLIIFCGLGKLEPGVESREGDVDAVQLWDSSSGCGSSSETSEDVDPSDTLSVTLAG